MAWIVALAVFAFVVFGGTIGEWFEEVSDRLGLSEADDATDSDLGGWPWEDDETEGLAEHVGPLVGIPEAPGGEAVVADLPLMWEATLPVAPWSVQGLGSYGADAIVTGAAYVVRVETESYSSEIAGLVGLDREDGTVLWVADLPSAVCAPEPFVLPALADQAGADQAGTVIACAAAAGRGAGFAGSGAESAGSGAESVESAGSAGAAALPGDGAWRLVLLDPASGAVLRETSLSAPASSIEATAAGAAVLGLTDATTLATPLTWYDARGEERWQVDLLDVDPEVREWMNSDSETPGPWGAQWARAGDLVLLTLGAGTYPIGDRPLTSGTVRECGAVVPLEDAFLCSGVETERVAADGATTWSIEDSLAWGPEWAVPVPLVHRWEDGGAVYRLLDPETGSVGEPVLTTDYYPFVTGTRAQPVVASGERLVGLAPGGAVPLWQHEMGEVAASAVSVSGDRIVVPVAYGAPTLFAVLDAATGAETARFTTEWAVITPLGDRRVMVAGWDGTVSVRELP